MKFLKYHGTGNDFIILEKLISEQQIKFLCNRHFGIGADGILFLCQSEKADAKMRIFNSDGSEAEMCGNGLRCFVDFLYNFKNIKKKNISVETKKGILNCEVNKKNTTVSLGKPKILTDKFQNKIINKISEKNEITMFGIDMGNPHLILIPNKNIDIEKAKNLTKQYKIPDFYEKELNVTVAYKTDLNNKSVYVVVNERGAGFTLSCGTGGGATAFSFLLANKIKEKEILTLNFPGGTVFYQIINNEIFLTGPAKFVFKGEIDV